MTSAYQLYPGSLYRADLDPIYLCELLNTCTVNDVGDAKITSIVVNPAKGPQGTTFAVRCSYINLM